MRYFLWQEADKAMEELHGCEMLPILRRRPLVRFT